MKTWLFWKTEFRSRSVWMLFLCLMVAVASMSSVRMFTERMQTAMVQDARKLLGADWVVVSDRLLPMSFKARAQAMGLKAIEAVNFPSMAIAGDKSTLVSLKAVEDPYPLRGQLVVSNARAGEPTAVQAIPPNGSVWLDEAALSALGVNVGEQIQLGDARFTVDRVIVLEPDRGAAFVNFAPRAMIRMSDLPSTGLLQVGSRATFRLMVAGDRAAGLAFKQWLDTVTESGQKVESIDNGRPEMRATLDKAEKFLGLAGMLGTLVACIGLALAAQQHAASRLKDMALFKALGISPRTIKQLWLRGVCALSLVFAAAGALLGVWVQAFLARALSELLKLDLPEVQWQSLGESMLLGMGLTFAFVWPSVARSLTVSPQEVLRERWEDAGASRRDFFLRAATFTGVSFALAYWVSRDAKLSLAVVLGLGGTLLVFLTLARLAMAAGAQITKPLEGTRNAWGQVFRYAWVSLGKRSSQTIAQGMSLTLGITALLLLTVVKADLIEAWERTLPADAPNRFALNIQPEQKAAFSAFIQSAGIAQPELYPMVRGRLISVNDKPVSPDDFSDERAKRLVDREFNLSYSDELPAHNGVEQGQWFSGARDEISLETGIAKTLGLGLGDRLTFDVAGQTVQGRVTNLRRLRWDSMKVNFFVMFPTAALKAFPQSWITAFHLPPEQSNQATALVKAFPNITLVDTGVAMAQIRTVLSQVAQAVQFVFGFTLVAGALVLAVSLEGGSPARRKEMALLRALGASSLQLRRALWLELAFIGLLAGFLSSLSAQLIGWAVARTAFDFTYTLSPALVLGSCIAGVVLSALAGSWVVRSLLKVSPLQGLRDVN